MPPRNHKDPGINSIILPQLGDWIEPNRTAWRISPSSTTATGNPTEPPWFFDSQPSSLHACYRPKISHPHLTECPVKTIDNSPFCCHRHRRRTNPVLQTPETDGFFLGFRTTSRRNGTQLIHSSVARRSTLNCAACECLRPVIDSPSLLPSLYAITAGPNLRKPFSTLTSIAVSYSRHSFDVTLAFD